MYLSFFEGISITPEFSGQTTYPTNAGVFAEESNVFPTSFKQKYITTKHSGSTISFSQIEYSF